MNHVVNVSFRNLFLLRLLKNSSVNWCLNLGLFLHHPIYILEYCSPLFTGLNKTKCEKLEKIQNRVHRILCGMHCNLHRFETLYIRRKHAAITLFKKAMSFDCILNKILKDKLLWTSMNFCLNALNYVLWFFLSFWPVQFSFTTAISASILFYSIYE